MPHGATMYGEVFGHNKKLEAVTLLDCTSRHSQGHFSVGAYIYWQAFVDADCVALGILLDDEEIAQVQSPQTVYLTCPGLDEYGVSNYRPREFWKEGAPTGRRGAYRIDDLEKSIFTQPAPIVIEIDIGSITILLVRLENNTTTMRYSIEILLNEPVSKDEVNRLIYYQFLTFISIMAGRRDCIATHNIVISSSQTRDGQLSTKVNYGYVTRSTYAREYDIRNTLLMGSDANIRMFTKLFPKWRENFAFVEDLAFHYLEMVDHATEANILQAFAYIEDYVLKRLLEKNKKGITGIFEEVMRVNGDYFLCSNRYAQHFASDRLPYIAEQLNNFRNSRVHLKSSKDCEYSLEEVYAYINVTMRTIFLREMEYPKELAIGDHWWPLWRHIERE